MSPNDSVWQGVLLGLGDDGITYHCQGDTWQPYIPPLKLQDKAELAAVTEQLENTQAELLKSNMRERLAREDYKYQKNRADDAGFMLIEANQQRDEFKSHAETAINDHEMSEIRNYKLTEQLAKAHETIGIMIDEIGMLQLKDKATTEQRDRLAEAIRKHKDTFQLTPDCHICDEELYKALQSLTPND
jgi:hypothetical protein